MIPAPIYGHVKKPTDKDQSQTHCTSSSGGGTTYTLQITDVFYIPLTPWCGPLQSCVQGTVSSDRRHYLHTADNRCILHTSNTLVRTAPIMCSRHCVMATPLPPLAVCMVTGTTLPRLASWLFQNL